MPVPEPLLTEFGIYLLTHELVDRLENCEIKMNYTKDPFIRKNEGVYDYTVYPDKLALAKVSSQIL